MQMSIMDDQYQNHTVFDDLERYIAFYNSLATSVFSFVKVGTKAVCNIDSYLFSSVAGTLISIRMILKNGMINDAYALLRKYYDSAVINTYTNLFLQENISIDNFVVQKIDGWVQGKEKLPKYRVMSPYIRGSSKVSGINNLLFTDNRYILLRDRCNDHTHYNFFRNVLLNDSQLVFTNQLKALEEFSSDLRDVLILHIAYIFTINDHYMMASDHMDCLECGLTPDPDSEYWVAPFVQDIFDQTLKKYRPDVVAEIKKCSSMHLK